jgi:hypothetical protein
MAATSLLCYFLRNDYWPPMSQIIDFSRIRFSDHETIYATQILIGCKIAVSTDWLDYRYKITHLMFFLICLIFHFHFLYIYICATFDNKIIIFFSNQNHYGFLNFTNLCVPFWCHFQTSCHHHFRIGSWVPRPTPRANQTSLWRPSPLFDFTCDFTALLSPKSLLYIFVYYTLCSVLVR